MSAVSLPLGSWVGIRFKFSASQNSFLAAFGAGALLAALSVELIAPTTLALVDGSNHAGQDVKSPFYALVIGCILGGVLYILLDKIVNSKGGFLRKTSTLHSYYKKLQADEKTTVLNRISQIPVFQNFPPEQIDTLLSVLTNKTYKKGETIIEEGSPANEILIIYEGRAEAIVEDKKLGEINKEDAVMSILPVLTNTPNLGTAIAMDEVNY